MATVAAVLFMEETTVYQGFFFETFERQQYKCDERSGRRQFKFLRPFLLEQYHFGILASILWSG
jgi:hypothetical protein